MLADRQELDMGVTHLLNIIGKRMRQLAVIMEIILVFRIKLPESRPAP